MHTHRALFCLCLSAGLLAGAALPLSAQEAGVLLAGTVLDEAGAPVDGASVVAHGPIERGTLTGQDGVFRLGRVPAGIYQIRVDALGYGSAERVVQAESGSLALEFVVEGTPIALAPIEIVAAMRTGTSAATLPIKVEVIGQAEVGVQQSLASNPTELLANLIPSFSPGRQKLSSAGESFRGRRPLFLIDGVPQSNPLRDGRRDGFTIDPEVIEQIEVVFGANAIQGLGATGGIVNYVTMTPPLSGRLEQRASLSGTTGDAFDGDGLGWRAHYLAGKRSDAVDVLGSVSYEQRGLQYDARDRPIGIDNVQGDIADSRSWNLFGKVGWEPTEGQRLQLMVNDFRLEQEGGFDLIPGDRALGVPAVAVRGNPQGVEPINDVTTLSLDYGYAGFAGGMLSAKAYYQNFSALYGGGTFDSFQDPEIAPVGELFDQSENNSEKLGTRLTYAASRVFDGPVDVITGFDFLRDVTFQRLVHTDRNWVPETGFQNYAPFVQLDVNVLERVSLSGGIRWEIARLDVPTFTTLAANRDDYQPIEVAGGTPSFDRPLFNLGAVVTPTPGLRFYGTMSQAYTMPDVGRVLRGVSEPGTAVDDFLGIQPVETDNLEFGGAFGVPVAQIGVTWFESESEFGSRLVPNSDGIFQVRREPTHTSGWEVTGRLDAVRRLSLTAGYSILDGSFDGDGDGERESDLSAADIGPDRLNLTADINRGGRASGRLQSFTYFDETFRDGAGEETAHFDGYTTLDAAVSADVGFSRLSLSVSNLLDEQYITYFGQAGTTLADRYFAGRGRTLTLRVEKRF